ncbi:exodeoxyribonuclease I [Buchnera aphidicola]|uniref:exodeoxyribonuclease I n=1 Tax=Buchnera aphidicola TaxID=9 RepID=UPI003463FC00
MNYFLKYSFLFYDYETFGTHPVKDKPAQFACLRTDIDFNIISDPILLYCRPSIDYLPNPESILITSITPQYTVLHGSNESNFAKKIYEIFIQSNTCILGFNNIFFDDEITRNIFYRNFFDPYAWSWKNNNTRWDVINVTRAFYALRPSGIFWPFNKSKKCVSFKLQDLSKINNLLHHRAHDALSDVYATIEFLKLLRKKNFNFFRFLFFMRKKKNLLRLIKKNFLQPLIYISPYYGSKNSNFCRVLPLTFTVKNKNLLIVFDLDRKYSNDFFLKNKRKITKNIKNLFSFGMRLINLTRSPILIPVKILRNQDILRLKLNQDQFFRNFDVLKRFFNLDKIKEIAKINLTYESFDHSDDKLYENFFDFSDCIKMKKIRENIDCKNINHNIFMNDTRFEDLNFFFKARNFPNFLTSEEKFRWENYLKNFFNRERIFCYLKNIFSLKKKYFYDRKSQNLLNQTLLYLKYLKKKFT